MVIHRGAACLNVSRVMVKVRGKTVNTVLIQRLNTVRMEDYHYMIKTSNILNIVDLIRTKFFTLRKYKKKLETLNEKLSTNL